MITDTDLLTALESLTERAERLARDHTDGHGFTIADGVYRDLQALGVCIRERVAGQAVEDLHDTIRQNANEEPRGPHLEVVDGGDGGDKTDHEPTGDKETDR